MKPDFRPPSPGRAARAASLIASAELLACATTSTGPEPEPPVPTSPSQEVIQAYLQPGPNPLAALTAARDERNEFLFATNQNWVAGLWYAEAGAYGSASQQYTPFFQGRAYAEAPDDGQCDSAELPDAVEAFCERIDEPDAEELEFDPEARAPNFVFIGDLPNFPSARVFGQRMLQCARDLGFRYFAVEALREDAAAVASRGDVAPDSGVLTREPQFARMIRQALDLGYELVSYDVSDRTPGVSFAQDVSSYAEPLAANLLAKTYALDPDAKVLVWTAPLQARKRPWVANGATSYESVAWHVFEETGVEPYSLEHVVMDPGESLGPETPSGLYLAGGPVEGDCAGAFYPQSVIQDFGALDGIVFQTPAEGDAARWQWLHATEEERMTVRTECAGCSGQLLVRAFPAGEETTNRVPADQALCNPGAACQLVLPPGDYQFVVWSADAQVGEQQASLAAGGTATLTF